MRAYRAQNQALKALFNPVLDEPIPENLHVLASPTSGIAVNRPARPLLARWSAERIAAGVMIALLGGVAGCLLHGQYPPEASMARMIPFPQQASIDKGEMSRIATAVYAQIEHK